MDPTGETHNTPPSRKPSGHSPDAALEYVDETYGGYEAAAVSEPEAEEEATVGPHPLTLPSEAAPLKTQGATPGFVEMEAATAVREQANQRSKERKPKKKKKPEYIERDKADISDKVAWGGGAGLIVAGLLSYLEAYTGVPTPEGLDQYAVALVMIAVSYFKKDRA